MELDNIINIFKLFYLHKFYLISIKNKKKLNGNVKRCQMSMFERRVSVPRLNFFFKKKALDVHEFARSSWCICLFFFKKKEKYKQHMFRF